MIAELRCLQYELAFELELVDIDKDPDLRKRYNVDVPVVTLGTEVVCFHFFEEDMVRQALQNGWSKPQHSEFFHYCAYWPR